MTDLIVSAATPRAYTFTATAGQTALPINCAYFDQADVRVDVWREDEDGELQLAASYQGGDGDMTCAPTSKANVSGGVAGTATVPALQLGDTVHVYTLTDPGRAFRWGQSGPFKSDWVNAEVERLLAVVLENRRDIGRAFKAPFGEDPPPPVPTMDWLDIVGRGPDISAVAARIADVETVADADADIGVVAANITDVVQVGNALQGGSTFAFTLLGSLNLPDFLDRTGLTPGTDIVSIGGTETISGLKTIQRYAATVEADYLALKPTDFGNGKHGLFISKMAAANGWRITTYDGDDTAGVINFVCEDLQLNGVNLVPTSGFVENADIGVTIQPHDAKLAAFAGQTPTADRLSYWTGGDTLGLAVLTAAGRALLDDANPAAMRTTLELGSSAVKNTGTSGDAVPLLNQAAHWTGHVIFGAAGYNGASLRAKATGGAPTMLKMETSAGVIRYGLQIGDDASGNAFALHYYDNTGLYASTPIQISPTNGRIALGALGGSLVPGADNAIDVGSALARIATLHAAVIQNDATVANSQGASKALKHWADRIYPGTAITRTSAAGSLQAALNAQAAGGMVIVDTDETITTRINHTVTGNLFIVWEGGHRTLFNLPNNTDDCWTLTNNGYRYVHFANPNIDFQFTGRDGFHFNGGHISWSKIQLTRPWRDLWCCDMAGDWDWFENFNIEGGLASELGRHCQHIVVNNGSGVQFANENNQNFEIRGIGRRHPGTENGGHGCNAIRITAINSIYPVKVADWRFFGSNWDVDQAGSYDVANGKYAGQSGYVAGSAIGDIVEVISLNGSVIEVGNFDFRGTGGLESVSSTVTGKYVIRLTTDGNPAASIISKGHQLGHTPYNWAYLFQDSIMNEDSVGGRYGANGRYLEKLLTKPNGVTLKGDAAGIVSNFRDIGRNYRKRVTLASSTTVDVDIPVAALGAYNDTSVIEVRASHHPYWNGLGVAARWEVYVSRDATTDRVNVRLFDELDTGAANAFDPSAVTWSRPNNTTLRMSLPCGASVGAGGRNSTCWITAARPEGLFGFTEKTSEPL